MDRLWKWVMRLNAKLICLAALALFACTAVWCGLRASIPPTPFPEGSGDAEKSRDPISLGTLEYVSNQVSEAGVEVPVDPFRPTLEAIFTNETQRAAFLAALKKAREGAAGLNGSGKDGKTDPFAALRNKNQVPGQTVGPNGQPMVTPKISFLGFVQRSDGSKGALFNDSTGDSFFYEPGKKVHGVEITDANSKSASIKFPDGTTKVMPIGESVELAAEPAKAPAAGAAKAPAKAQVKGKDDAKAAAAKAKPGQIPKPGQNAKGGKPMKKPGAK